MENFSPQTIKKAMKEDDSKTLVKELDDLKGSSAVKYVLRALLAKGNEHTLQSLLELIEERV